MRAQSMLARLRVHVDEWSRACMCTRHLPICTLGLCAYNQTNPYTSSFLYVLAYVSACTWAANVVYVSVGAQVLV
jgi:hypothetical protein